MNISPMVPPLLFHKRLPILGMLSLFLIIFVLPLAVFVSQQQQQTQQHAATNSLTAPSGQAMPVGDIPGWHQIFTDDFTTDVPLGNFPRAVSNKWDAYPDGWKDTSKNGTYSPSKVVSIQNGVMNLYLHTENGIHMVSAPEPKLPGATGTEGGLLSGRYVIRFKADPVPGYKTAWLLWPDSETWPRDGEIDFPEGTLDGTICAYMHRQNGTSGGDQDEYCTSATYRSWHTAIIEWLPNKLTFFLDGQSIGTSTSRVPNTPMHWVIQTETTLDGTIPNDTAAGNVQIDWVAVYVPSNEMFPRLITASPPRTPSLLPSYPTPKLYCLGACPTLPLTPAPSQAFQPSQLFAVPSIEGTIAPSTIPSSPPQSTHRKKLHPTNPGLFKQLCTFLLQILMRVITFLRNSSYD